MAVVIRQEGNNYYKVHKVQLPNATLIFENKRNSAERAGLSENGTNLSPAGTVSTLTISPSPEDVKYDEGASYSRVRDKKKSAALNSEDYVTTYRAMVLIDGKLYPPMATYIGGKLTEGAELGDWLQADEHPELIKIDKKTGKPKFDLEKGVVVQRFTRGFFVRRSEKRRQYFVY